MSMIQAPSKAGMMKYGGSSGMASVLGGGRPVPWLQFPLSVDASNTLSLAPTFDRTTTATFVDYEGVVRMADINEMRFEGGRRVKNIHPISEPTSGWSAAGTTPPSVSYEQHLGLNAVKIDFPALSNTGYSGCRGASSSLQISSGNTLVAFGFLHFSRLLVGSEKINFYITGAQGTVETSINATTSVNYIDSYYQTLVLKPTPFTVSGSDSFVLYVFSQLQTPLTVWVTKLQAEQKTGASDSQTPSEYVVTTGTAASKWFGTRPDGTPIVPAPMLLMEGQGQNLCTYSDDLTNSTWTKASLETPTMVAGNAFYGNYGNKVTPTSGTTNYNFYRTPPIATVDTVYTISCTLSKATGFDYFRISIGAGWKDTYNASSISFVVNLNTGAVTITGTTDPRTITVKPLNGGYRVSATMVRATGDQIFYFYPCDSAGNKPTGDSIKSVLFGAFQYEQSSILSSYIPTTTSAVTRTADSLSWPLSTELQAMLSAEGTMVIDWVPGYIPPASQIGVVSCVGNVDSLLSVATSGTVSRSTDGATPITGAATLASNTMKRIALIWSAANQTYQLASIASGIVTKGTAATFDGAFTQGANLLLHYSNIYPAKYSNLRFFRRVLTDAELLRL